MKALFLVNERSGRKRDFDVSDVIRRTAPFEHEIVGCARKEDVDAILDRAESESFDIVYAVGGDGTVHEIAKRLIGTPLALGILPTGSGNGFARHVGLPPAPRHALLACRGGRVVTIDTAEVNGRPFVGVMGVGFDAFIADRFASSTTRGMRTYVREGIRGFRTYEPEEYEMTVDGATSTRRAFVIAVANSSQYGNNARIAPLASLQDGLLDLVVIERASLLRAPLLLARLFAGTLHRSRAVHAVQGRAITIRRPSPAPAHLDGEPVGDLGTTLEVRIRPLSLKVLVPAGTARL
ncbi:MAG TPA: YegS/Rv2252/BmrU family lipid kinase [Thermoanaerobaculia bacterium]|nr:YegS/Rv2252/BmrU family lipid kinase [Thermoanaerobaculia bacterium]